jgi:hypothetical protein
MTLLQRAYLCGYRRALARMNGELKEMICEMKAGWDDEIADLKDVVDNIERDYANAKEVAKVMAERDPEITLH